MAVLSETSAFVLLLADGTVHTHKNSRKFLGMLDLSAGRRLLEQCNMVWAHYDQVIKNRKKCILELTRQIVTTGRAEQVVIFGAGMDALSVELLSGTKSLKVFEVDSSNMQLKNRLLKEALGDLHDHIRCIGVDLKDPCTVHCLLREHGWEVQRPTVLVFEGISYYLSRRNLFGLIGLFGTGRRRNSLVLEYLLPAKRISKERAHIPAGVFGAIKSRYGTPLCTYDSEMIRSLLGPDMGIVDVFGLRDMERQRTGKNTHFEDRRSGWIEVCHAAL